MDPKIAERYTNDILQEAMQRYGIKHNEIELLDGFESFMYEFYRPQDGEFILRIGHSGRRTPEMIAGEVDWINYLARGGANVSRAILSKNGKLVEAIADGHGEQFLATAFLKAPGVPPWEATLSSDFLEHYGRVIGRIHALTKDYVPPYPTWKRPEWDSPGNLEIADWLPASESAVLQKFQELLPYFETLPKDRESYGLIHQDAHGGNFFVHEGKITLFDFDDCVYGWFIYDIAMVFFYGLMGYEHDPIHVEEYASAFFKGYSQENTLDPKWLDTLPYFLKLREIDLYALIHRSFDVENLEDAWCRRYMEGRKEKIENEVPYIDFDWSALIQYLQFR